MSSPNCVCLSVLARVSTVIKYHNPKQLGRKEFILFYTLVHYREKSGQELSQDRNLEIGTEAETMEECCLLAHSLSDLLSLLLVPSWTPSQGCHQLE